MAVKETARRKEAAWPTRGSLFLPTHTLFKAFQRVCQLSWHGSYFFTYMLHSIWLMCTLRHSWILARPSKVAWCAQACSMQCRAPGRGSLGGWGVLPPLDTGVLGVAKTGEQLLTQLSPDVAEMLFVFVFQFWWCWGSKSGTLHITK